MAIGDDQVMFTRIEGSQRGAAVIDCGHRAAQSFELALDKPAIGLLILGNEDAHPSKAAVADMRVVDADSH